MLATESATFGTFGTLDDEMPSVIPCPPMASLIPSSLFSVEILISSRSSGLAPADGPLSPACEVGAKSSMLAVRLPASRYTECPAELIEPVLEWLTESGESCEGESLAAGAAAPSGCVGAELGIGGER